MSAAFVVKLLLPSWPVLPVCYRSEVCLLLLPATSLSQVLWSASSKTLPWHLRRSYCLESGQSRCYFLRGKNCQRTFCSYSSSSL